jgi:hypothetical protein
MYDTLPYTVFGVAGYTDTLTVDKTIGDCKHLMWREVNTHNKRGRGNFSGVSNTRRHGAKGTEQHGSPKPRLTFQWS